MHKTPKFSTPVSQYWIPMITVLWFQSVCTTCYKVGGRCKIKSVENQSNFLVGVITYISIYDMLLFKFNTSNKDGTF